jgi:mono/diheme cytochrome c family protein
MKKKKAHQKPAAAPSKPNRIGLMMALVVVAAGLGALAWKLTHKTNVPESTAEAVYQPRPPGQLTFNKHIAPIVFQNCATCHRPGQSAPFALLNFADVKKHANDIATVTARRYMPPWLPEHGYGRFAGERRLSADEIGMIQQWVAEGTAEGEASDLPALPKWAGDWQLGQPDLVLMMPQPYTLPAEGRDVYRNFVIPGTVAKTRFIRGVEFRPGNQRVVHHAFIRVDATGQCRRLDEQDAEPGFGGMNSPARMPDGQLLGWQPGRVPAFQPDGLAWRLNPGEDLVIEMHLNPSGKPEPVQSSIGLYFTDQPPTNTCFKMALTSLSLDIPAGVQDHVVEQSFQLPVDVQALAVLPHAHYLAKEMKGWATLPDGSRQWLLFIKQWDFNWQGDYRYAQPLFLPKGSVLSMRYTYDNSTNNARNPNHPPKPVGYGAQSSDEMAELWFQLLPRDRNDLAMLERDYQAKLAVLTRQSNEQAIRKNPDDAKAHVDLGLIVLAEKKPDEAERHFRAAIQARPDFARAHYCLGLVLRQRNQIQEALKAFETAVRLDPKDGKAHGNLGFIFAELGDIDSAQLHFETALRLNPSDALARSALNELLQAKSRLKPGR